MPPYRGCVEASMAADIDYGSLTMRDALDVAQ
jgi:hypothetical protein